MLFDLALYIYRATCRVRSNTVFASECAIVHTRVSSETIDAEGRPLSAPPVKTPRSKRRDVSNFAQPFPRNMRRFDKRLQMHSGLAAIATRDRCALRTGGGIYLSPHPIFSLKAKVLRRS